MKARESSSNGKAEDIDRIIEGNGLWSEGEACLLEICKAYIIQRFGQKTSEQL